MGIAGSIARTHWLISAAIFFLTVGVSSAVTISTLTGLIRPLLDHALNQYDLLFPEIIIEKGHASISKPQPYYVEQLTDKDTAVIIDTRESRQQDSMKYLETVKNGIVLTRDTIIIKNNGQLRILQLNGMPDMVLNSSTVSALIDTYLPLVTGIGSAIVIFYYLAIKIAQILVFALLPYLVMRSKEIGLSYGKCVKLACFGIIPPIALDMLRTLVELKIPAQMIMYFVVFLSIMGFLTWDYLKDSREPY